MLSRVRNKWCLIPCGMLYKYFTDLDSKNLLKEHGCPTNKIWFIFIQKNVIPDARSALIGDPLLLLWRIWVFSGEFMELAPRVRGGDVEFLLIFKLWDNSGAMLPFLRPILLFIFGQTLHPVMGIFDAELFWVKGVFIYLVVFLFLIIFKRFHGRSCHEKDD